jgi:hypothetical protein
MCGWVIIEETLTATPINSLQRTMMISGSSPGTRWAASISQHKLTYVLIFQEFLAPTTERQVTRVQRETLCNQRY